MNKITHGDSLVELKNLESDSVDLLCTDPPYGYSFMGKSWDKTLPDIGIFKECLRVLKPGAFAFVMSAPRSDVCARMMLMLEDAGFEIGFTPIYWTYASGFPKAMNIGKAVDKRGGQDLSWFIEYAIAAAAKQGKSKRDLQMLFPSKNGNPTGWLWNKRNTQGITVEQYNTIKHFLNLPFATLAEAEREVVGKKKAGLGSGKTYAFADNKTNGQVDITAPATAAAKTLEGSYGGFQPKPAVEVVIVAMKPLSEKTFVDQALKNGKGVTWLDDCRVPTQDVFDIRAYHDHKDTFAMYENKGKGTREEYEVKQPDSGGRFPANLIVSDDVLNDGRNRKSNRNKTLKHDVVKTEMFGEWEPRTTPYTDNGSYSRYFSLDTWAKTLPFLIVPKASKREKNPDDIKNIHPTCKPLTLMFYLITLGSREGDVVLDPFLGSGTTALAAKHLGRQYIGIEREKEYVEIAEARLKETQPNLFEGKAPELTDME